MYEDYMQNLLGVRMSPYQNTYDQFNTDPVFYDDDYMNNYVPYNYSSRNSGSVDLENCYPEIYKIVYPMVRKACMQNTKPITQDLIDEMTRDIYNNIETGDIINLNINVENSSFENNRDNTQKNIEESRKVSDEKVENRQFNNSMNDLIKILLIRELLGRPGWGGPNRPPRPNPPGGWRPNNPNRPPMPRF